MINIVCLKWGAKYGPAYVNKLLAGIKRHSTVAFKFHCFTEDATNLHSEVIVHKLPFDDLEGWWNKLYLFSNDINIPIGETIFYVDLDTLITSNIDELLNHRSETLTALRDFYWGLAQTANKLGSGLMSWEHGKHTNIWEKFIVNPTRAIASVAPHGDQHWIARCVAPQLYWQDLFVDKVVSFKVHCCNGLPNGAAIVCYHGRPSIPESATTSGKSWKFKWSPQSWVQEHWIE